MKREAFMARVRAALGTEAAADARATAPAPPPDVDETIMRLAGPDDDIVALFADRAAAVGFDVHRTTEADLPAAITGLVETLGAKQVTVALADADATRDVQAAIERAGGTVVDWRGRPGIAAHYDADLGVTDVQAALAETGTLVVVSDAAHSRGTFIAPPVHAAVVRAADIVPDMIDYWNDHPSPGASGACTVFVTGPSKTADIEGILITGVHGPRAVHVLLVE